MKTFHGVFVLAFTVCGVSLAEDKINSSYKKNTARPLWEFGFGAVGGWVPDYPAAGQNHFKGIPFPIPVYRGDIFRVGDRKGAIRGRFLNTEEYEFDISLQAAFPVNSSDNNARRGMPDLDWLVGVGPQLSVKLFNNPGINRLNLNIPVRAIFSSDLSSIENRGYVFNPQLTYRHENLTNKKLRLFASIGPIFASGKLMDYFYTVKPKFATSTRPAFRADGGYLGSELTVGLSTKPDEKLRFFLGSRIGLYEGATNENSPLFRGDLTVGVVTGFIWSIWQSQRRVQDSE